MVESLSVPLHRMDIRRSYEKLYKNNIHANIMIAQSLQKQLGVRTSIKPRMKGKACFMELVVVFNLYLKAKKLHER